jgi:hypothetical protein
LKQSNNQITRVCVFDAIHSNNRFLDTVRRRSGAFFKAGRIVDAGIVIFTGVVSYTVAVCTGSNAALGIMEEILITMLSGLNLTSVQPDAGSSSDTADWVDAGVPGVELFSYNENYFYWHHTFGRTARLFINCKYKSCVPT